MAAEAGRAAQRLLRLWLVQGRMSLIWILRGGWEAAAWLVADAIANLGAVTATFLLAQRFDGIGDWSRADVVFLAGYALLVNGLVGSLAGYNVGMISRRIGRGQLDHSLLQPRPLWQTLLTEGFAPFDLCFVVVIGLALLAWAVRSAGLPAGPGWLALLTLDLAASTVVVLAFQFAWGSLAFWAPRAAEEVSTAAAAVSGLAAFPLDRAGPALQAALLSAFPVGLVAWVPCRVLLGVGRPLPAGPLLTPAAAAGLGGLALIVFRRGLRHYERTGSARYSDLGHRR
jgi:ABC-2 type transport system permease protein